VNNEALPTFLAEAQELSEEIESALLACDRGAADADTINALFRAVHTIKGSAGLFGLNRIVEFAHVVETVLDRVRNGAQEMTSDLVHTLIGCRDHINVLLDAVTHEGANEACATEQSGVQLLERLQEIAGVVERRKAAAPKSMAASSAVAEDPSGPRVGSDCWHLSLRFKPEVLCNGMDPLASLSFLRTFGEIVAIELLDDALPPLNQFDPEACYLGFELRFHTEADRERIEGAFEFVREDCIMTLLPPRSRVADYVRLVKELPESGARLGEILVRCGSLTQYELDQALRQQSEEATQGVAARIGQILIETRTVSPAVVEAAIEKQQQTELKGTSREQRSVRVDADKLEALINLVGELVIAGAATNLLAQRANLSELNESSQRLARLVEEVRDQTLQLRMMQIGGTFARFARVVRDVSRELDKDIHLETSGAETELDKTLIEKITDPLTHLVRNAMDHGIEPSDVRLALGKKTAGVVRLNAYHDSGSVVIEVADDGGGLRREKILNKALERGLVAPGQQLTDKQVYALIFEPGFSTADAVTNLSGRGVGMDVVKRNVMALRGTVDIESKEGEGTTVRIRLPLTLAIIEGFLVRVGNSFFVIPLEMVEECVESGVAGGMLESRDRYIDLRGEVLPYVRLREHFGVSGKPGRRESIVVVRCGNLRAGFVVDDLLGEYQTVIKPLARVFQHVRGLGGSTILADGGIALILDAPALIAECQRPGDMPATAAA
jgi:two-component system, chemotaxis family, sensor kinase CheA